jgi:uncharacterized protein YdcH (DUF465 family)
MIENHSLANELPEYRDAIHQLKMSDAHFAKVFDGYHELDKEIHRIENGIENTADDYLEKLKKQRLNNKDELFAMLKKAENT